MSEGGGGESLGVGDGHLCVGELLVLVEVLHDPLLEKKLPPVLVRRAGTDDSLQPVKLAPDEEGAAEGAWVRRYEEGLVLHRDGRVPWDPALPPPLPQPLR